MDHATTMDQLKLSQESLTVVGVALRMVAESDDRMNTYSDETRESLENEARAIIAGCDNANHVKKRG